MAWRTATRPATAAGSACGARRPTVPPTVPPTACTRIRSFLGAPLARLARERDVV